jgi:hypothetical protein
VSSLVRRIQRKGSRIGAPTRADAPDKLAREAREALRRSARERQEGGKDK